MYMECWDNIVEKAADNFWRYVRTSIIGRDTVIQTPFGERIVTYADYTASGRGLTFIEEIGRASCRERV